MSIHELEHLYPISSEEFRPYIRPVANPINPTHLDLSLIPQERYSELRAACNGDFSLLIRYKGYEGGILSLAEQDGDLSILQLKGGRSQKSYRVTTYLRWIELFADQTKRIATTQDEQVRRILMHSTADTIGGYVRSYENAANRYLHLVGLLDLNWSAEEKAFVKDLHPTKTLAVVG